MPFIDLFFLLMLIIVIAGLLISTSNALWVHRLEDFDLDNSDKAPLVSILVPARNEERNINACLLSLLSQDYPNFEVIVLNDHSTDETANILSSMTRDHSNLTVLQGKTLPAGWPGKHWACHQLAQAARGDLLLFTDADTRHDPQTLRRAVAGMQHEGADLLSALPRQEVVSWAEKLIIPFMNWAIHSYLPLRLAQKLQLPSFSLTIGQFMLFKRQAFEAVGGFEGATHNVNDDVALGRAIISAGYEWRLMNGAKYISCRMYRSLNEILNGFSKNVFGFFDYCIIPFVAIFLFITLAFLEPLWAVSNHALKGMVSDRAANYAWLAIIGALLLFSIAYRRLRVPLYLVIFYPVTIFLFTLIALRSMVFSLTGRASWKDRELGKSTLRWF